MNTLKPEITIVGAGVAGCVAALDLGMSGRRVLLLERSRTIPEKGSDFLKPRGIDVLQRLGVIEPLLRNGAIRGHRIRYFHDGELLFELDYREKTHVGYFLIVAYPILIRSLLAAMKPFPNIEVRFETKIAAVPVSDDDGLVLELEDGQRIDSPIVIGADGSHSQVRKALGIAVERQAGPHLFYTAEIPAVPSVWESNRMYFSSNGLAAYFYPFGVNNARVFLIMTPEQEKWLWSQGDEPLAQLLRPFVKESDDVLPQLPRLEAFFKFEPEMFLADEYFKGNAVLLGNSVFSVNPLTGQGMNMAIEDAEVLNRQIIAFLEGNGDLFQALGLYYEKRRAVHLEILDYGKRTADFHDRAVYTANFDPRLHGGEPGKPWRDSQRTPLFKSED